MKKYKLSTQRIIFSGNEVITIDNKVITKEFYAIECQENYDTTKITEENINIAKEFGYKVGDEIKILKSVSFIDNKKEKETIELMLGDPYYKVEVQNESGGFDILFKHKCNH